MISSLFTTTLYFVKLSMDDGIELGSVIPFIDLLVLYSHIASVHCSR